MLDISSGSVGWRYSKMDIKPAASLKKALFCEPNCEQSQEDLKSMMQEIEQSNNRRWNFDFKNNVPLPGSYKWESVSTIRSVPPKSGTFIPVTEEKDSEIEKTTEDVVATTTATITSSSQPKSNSPAQPSTPRQGKIDGESPMMSS